MLNSTGTNTFAQTHTSSSESQRHKHVQIPACLKVTLVVTEKLSAPVVKHIDIDFSFT